MNTLTVVAIVVAVLAGLIFLGRRFPSKTTSAINSSTGSKTRTPGGGQDETAGAIAELVRVATPEAFQITESTLAFVMQIAYKRDLATLPVEEYGKAVPVLGMQANGDVRAGDVDAALEKVAAAARFALHPKAKIRSDDLEAVAVAGYNCGSPELAFILISRMDFKLGAMLQIEPAIKAFSGADFDDLTASSPPQEWLARTSAWRRTTLSGEALRRYEDATRVFGVS